MVQLKVEGGGQVVKLLWSLVYDLPSVNLNMKKKVLRVTFSCVAKGASAGSVRLMLRLRLGDQLIRLPVCERC